VTDDTRSDDDRMLEQALAALPEPELPRELAARLDAIPEHGVVRRFPLRAWRVSALGWAAAAAIGLFIGTEWSGEETESLARGDAAAESAPARTSNETADELDDASDADDLALATGAFTEFGEEP
jgi:hypothetical protein